ncbi:hypothetical protein DFH06DRAFT_1123852 [Mycena polygramma]|nr:hypothetical protein DFH06DRAFT_1123852 [Mycena polygramma]
MPVGFNPCFKSSASTVHQEPFLLTVLSTDISIASPRDDLRSTICPSARMYYTYSAPYTLVNMAKYLHDTRLHFAFISTLTRLFWPTSGFSGPSSQLGARFPRRLFFLNHYHLRARLQFSLALSVKHLQSRFPPPLTGKCNGFNKWALSGRLTLIPDGLKTNLNISVGFTWEVCSTRSGGDPGPAVDFCKLRGFLAQGRIYIQDCNFRIHSANCGL